jgi:hypothetical protein
VIKKSQYREEQSPNMGCSKLRNNNNNNNNNKSILAESGPGTDNSKLNLKKRKIFQKYKVTDTKEIAQLIENLKQKIQAKAQRIRRYEKRKNRYIQNKLFKENTKQFYRYLGAKTIAMKEQPHMEEVESYWKSLWEEKVKHNEEAEWIRKEKREKEKNK